MRSVQVASLLDRLREELNASRKTRNKPLTPVLGTILADIENHHTTVQRDLAGGSTINRIAREELGTSG